VIIRPAVEFPSIEAVLVVLTPPATQSGALAADGRSDDEGR
jgi:hypothetical protein